MKSNLVFITNPIFQPSNSNFCSSQNSTLLPCCAGAPWLNKRLTALSIDSSTEGDPCLLGKLCISDFQGPAVLSLWDSLQSSTQEGRIVSGWPLHLGETLLPWISKDKKCCLYETPYVAAPNWVLGDIIAKFSTLRATSYRCTYKSQIFFWFMSDAFLKRPVSSYWDS